MFEKSVCVYCGSASGADKVYEEHASKLGRLLNANKWRLVYGGGTTGLMGTIARTTMKGDGTSKGSVLGIIPNALVDKERSNTVDLNEIDDYNNKIKESVENHSGLSPISKEYGETFIVPDMHTRKKMMANESDAFVAMPGGFGTLEEIMECITWSQLGIHNKPIVLFNVGGFYDPLLEFVKKSIESGFISKNNGNIIAVAKTAQEVIDKINNYKIPDGRFTLNWSDDLTDNLNCDH
ncbi:hypothetical protein TPHA_0I02640 [Tetrapisispora phaffii CBS 4417]|uniref:Cytokinin riboside 5'-monophosphate phosphoribohydrolase n=1 Tax=Tetrapisispora phaffii (strain ATCC 24235 / CBS 4417 / NBRC 1672 / NRRL Y-8282 / UCD 70-5) TaxID=1071381 RepID=G8BXY7_TETPH|nr:hypothetical protein TPHA_0I02640 [Tetrapisispora phaffii CBS 4417]CCE64765.1 hypothetical protein TPHA_0I02640 [Tetrapisispora phaffii CBS 4417]